MATCMCRVQEQAEMTGLSGQWICPHSSVPRMSASLQSGVPGWCSPWHLPAKEHNHLVPSTAGCRGWRFLLRLLGQGWRCQTASLHLPAVPCWQPQSPFLHTPSPSGKPAVTLSQRCLTDHYFGNLREKGACPWSCVAGAILCSPSPPWHCSLRGQGHPHLFLAALG